MLVLTTPSLYLRWYQLAAQIAAPCSASANRLAARLVLAAFYFYPGVPRESLRNAG